MGVLNATRPEEFCGQIITTLSGDAAPAMVKKDSAFIDRIAAADNMRAWDLPNDIFEGKAAPYAGTPASRQKNVPVIYATYEKPYCAGGTSSPATAICDVNGATADERGWLQVGIGETAERNFVLNHADFVNFCYGPNERRVDQLARKAYEIRQEINKKAIEAAYLDADPYTDGVASIGATAKKLNIINAQGNAFGADYAKIRSEYRKSQYKGDVLVFGGEKVAEFMDVKILQGMGINGQGARDPQGLFGQNFVYDTDIDLVIEDILDVAAAGESHGLTLPLGHFGFFEWNEFGGDKALSMEHHVRTIVDIAGWNYDLEIAWIQCDAVWKIQLKKHYDFGSIPGAAYCNEQGLLFHWLFDCGNFAC